MVVNHAVGNKNLPRVRAGAVGTVAQFPNARNPMQNCCDEADPENSSLFRIREVHPILPSLQDARAAKNAQKLDKAHKANDSDSAKCRWVDVGIFRRTKNACKVDHVKGKD